MFFEHLKSSKPPPHDQRHRLCGPDLFSPSPTCDSLYISVIFTATNSASMRDAASSATSYHGHPNGFRNHCWCCRLFCALLLGSSIQPRIVISTLSLQSDTVHFLLWKLCTNFCAVIHEEAICAGISTSKNVSTAYSNSSSTDRLNMDIATTHTIPYLSISPPPVSINDVLNQTQLI